MMGIKNIKRFKFGMSGMVKSCAALIGTKKSAFTLAEVLTDDTGALISKTVIDNNCLKTGGFYCTAKIMLDDRQKKY